MTGNRDKVRSIFLTMLMVVSVFGATVAFAGTAASQEATGDPIEFEADSTGSNHVEVVFDQDISGNGYTYQVVNRSGGNVTTSVNGALTDNTTGRVVLDIGQDLSGNAELEVGGLGETLDITTTSSTIQNTSTPSEQAFKGENVAVIDFNEFNGGYSVKEGGEFPFLDRSTGSNSVVSVVNTSKVNELQAGDTYYVEFDDAGGSNVSLGMRNLGLSIEADETSYSFTGDNATIEATASSNVAPRADVEYRLLEDGDYEDNNQTVGIDGDGEQDVSFDVSDEGNYTIEVADLDTGITDRTDNIQVSEVSGDASFAQSVVSEERGDVARIQIDMSNRDTASVVIGSDSVNYVQEIEVEDDNDDGQVTLLFNTFRPSADSSFTANDDDDIVTRVDAASEPRVQNVGIPLASATYTMNITDGGVNASADDDIEEFAVGTLSLNDRATTDFRSWTAESGASLEDADAVAEYAEAGNLTRDSTVAEGDVVALQLQASGIYGAINATNSDNATDAIVQLNGGPINFSVYESDATIAPNANGAQVLDPNQLSHEVVKDSTNNNLYVVIESEALTDLANGQTGDRFVANFTVNPGSDLTPSGESETVTTEFRVNEQTLTFDADATLADGTRIVQAEAAPGQNITGQTNRAPGSEISITARATGDAPFLLDQDVTVQPDGSFAATFDFSNVSAGQNFTVDAGGSYEDDPETDGQVQAAATASVTFDDQSTSGEEVSVASATLSEGGFVTIHDSTLQDGETFGSVLGTSSYLEPGSSSGITVTLDDSISEGQTLIAMPHRDTNDNEAYDFVSSDGAQDGPYTSGGAAVTDSAEVTIETPTPTPTATMEPTATPTPTQTAEPTTAPPTTEPPSTPEPTTTTGDGTGFGLVAALIALIAAALLAVRRND